MTTTTTKTTSNRRATHNGTCQVCGSVQAVSAIDGTLAKHGYTTRWGFFSGTCSGSGWRPFEVATDRIAYSIELATQKRALLLDAAREATTQTDGVWVHFYKPATWTDRISGYVWALIAHDAIEVTTHTSGDYSWEVAQVANPYTNRKDEISRIYGDEQRAKGWRVVRNEERAVDLTKQATKVEQYIAWQQERIASWQPQELKARKGAR